MWYYYISRGVFGRAFEPECVYLAYSGRGDFRDDFTAIGREGLGPLPVGLYRAGPRRYSLRLGPDAIPLTPDPSNEMYGRSGFWLHGDNLKGDYSASSGCIVVQRAARLEVEPGDCIAVLP